MMSCQRQPESGYTFLHWERVRAAEGAALEMLCGVTATLGSNPSATATETPGIPRKTEARGFWRLPTRLESDRLPESRSVMRNIVGDRHAEYERYPFV